jgi:hypothetical protein
MATPGTPVIEVLLRIEDWRPNREIPEIELVPNVDLS